MITYIIVPGSCGVLEEKTALCIKKPWKLTGSAHHDHTHLQAMDPPIALSLSSLVTAWPVAI